MTKSVGYTLMDILRMKSNKEDPDRRSQFCDKLWFHFAQMLQSEFKIADTRVRTIFTG